MGREWTPEVPDRQIHEEIDEIELGWAEQDAKKQKLENKLAKLAPTPVERRKGNRKVSVHIRIDSNMIDWLRATGPNFHGRIRAAIQQYRDRIEK